MLFTPILGRAGSGKTTAVLEQIAQVARRGEKAMLLVPEQFSFEMEKAIFGMLEPAAADRVEVYSFTRLCHRLFLEYGGLAGENLSDAARVVLMSLALEQAQDRLELYRKPARSASFVGSMLQMVSEFQNAGVTPDSLREFSMSTDNAQLSQKTAELGEIYLHYQSLVQSRYRDEKDSLMRGCALARGKGFFQEYFIYVDSFMTYMAGEKELLKIMLEECQELTMTFPCDDLGNIRSNTKESRNNTPFTVARETALQLISAAKQLGVAVRAPQRLGDSKRFVSKELVTLEKSLCGQEPSPQQPGDGVRLVHLDTPYDEVRFVAAQIAEIVRNTDTYYRDIAVICRSLDRYRSAVEDLFARYEIPVFFDAREDILSVPLAAFLRSGLEAVLRPFDTTSMLALAKNSLMGLDCAQAAELENYCYTWDIRGKQWQGGAGFVGHPRGLEAHWSEEDHQLLERVRQAAETVARPVERLQQALEEETGSAFARGLYQFLLDTGAREHMTEYLQKHTDALGAQRYLQLNTGAWDLVIGLLELFDQAIGEIHLPLERLRDLFLLALQTADLGSIPTTLDQVALGTADRMRPNHPKVTFVLGANQGEFPPQLTENSLLSESERDQMAQAGFALNPTVIKRNDYELYYAYAALTSPSRQLIVTYHDALLTGESCLPSSIAEELMALFPGILEGPDALPPEAYAVNEATAFDLLCRQLQKDPVLAASVEQCLPSGDAPRLERIRHLLENKGFRIEDREVARVLFGRRMRLSPSRVDTFFQCPFAYFCQSGLGLRPRRKVEFSPTQSGTVIHHVLEQMVSRHGGKGLSQLEEEQLRQEVAELLEGFLKERVPAKEALTQRFRYLFGRLVRSLVHLLQRLGEEFAQSQFAPCAFELPINKDSDVQPLELRTPDGVTVWVEGVVDRVDRMEADGRTYIRVVDYKSGSKDFDLSQVYYGLNLQMLLYLFAIQQNGTGELGDALPAGVLYMPAQDRVLPVERGTPEEKIRQEHRKKYRMNGLLLDDPVSLSGMEEKLGGVFITVKTKKDGSLDARSSVASLAQLGQIRQHIEGLLVQMAEALSHGEIPALPAATAGVEPCKWCDFASICQHQPDGPARTLDPLSRTAFFERLTAEEAAHLNDFATKEGTEHGC